jgi:hypothetical protein
MKMVKALFGSNSRIKILNQMYLDPTRPYFIRELTRILDEQINSIRRELMNLKQIGLLKTKTKNRKKYFFLNKDCSIYPDIRNIFYKTSSQRTSIGKIIKQAGNVDLLILSGIFIGDEDGRIDVLIVSDDIDKKVLRKIMIEKFEYPRELRYAILSKADFFERLDFKDVFITKFLKSSDIIVEINKIGKPLTPFLENEEG